jgi:hypothetical protein
MPSALNCSERDGIDHQPRLEARLDGEEPADFLEHCHSLTFERPDGRFEPENS